MTEVKTKKTYLRPFVIGLIIFIIYFVKINNTNTDGGWYLFDILYWGLFVLPLVFWAVAVYRFFNRNSPKHKLLKGILTIIIILILAYFFNPAYLPHLL